MFQVVIVDDEPVIREGLRRFISRESGFSVINALKNGEQGLKAILESNPDIVVSDIVMPVMDGIEMVRHLRQQNIKSEIVLLSGYQDFEYARSAIRYNVFDYIKKPVNHDCLSKTLRDLAVKLDAVREAENSGSDYEGQIGRIQSYVRQNYNKDITVKHIAKVFYMNESYLSRFFKEKTGECFTDFLTGIRMERAKTCLSEGCYKIYEVAEMVGYDSPKYFARLFREHVGVTPHQYKLNGMHGVI